jgi:hypothetical protein
MQTLFGLFSGKKEEVVEEETSPMSMFENETTLGKSLEMQDRE